MAFGALLLGGCIASDTVHLEGEPETGVDGSVAADVAADSAPRDAAPVVDAAKVDAATLDGPPEPDAAPDARAPVDAGPVDPCGLCEPRAAAREQRCLILGFTPAECASVRAHQLEVCQQTDCSGDHADPCPECATDVSRIFAECAASREGVDCVAAIDRFEFHCRAWCEGPPASECDWCEDYAEPGACPAPDGFAPQPACDALRAQLRSRCHAECRPPRWSQCSRCQDELQRAALCEDAYGCGMADYAVRACLERCWEPLNCGGQPPRSDNAVEFAAQMDTWWDIHTRCDACAWCEEGPRGIRAECVAEVDDPSECEIDPAIIQDLCEVSCVD